MQETITFPTHTRAALYDITDRVAGVVADRGFRTGLCAVYAQGATAAVMIQQNWDESVQNDVVTLLRKIAPQGAWASRRGRASSSASSTGRGASARWW